jgi:hypothetical protein
VVLLLDCTNDYGDFDMVGGVAGMAGSSSQDSGQAGSTAGGSNTPDAGEGPDRAVTDASADASEVTPTNDSGDAQVDAGLDASIDAPFDAPRDAPVDSPGDAIADAIDAPSDAIPDAPGDVGLDATAEADATMAADASSDSAAADADAQSAPDVSVGDDASTDAPYDGAEEEAAPSCGSGTKLCGATCVNVTDPATGCAGTSCAPCSLPHASATCGASGECAVLGCGSGYEDCDTVSANGCEALLSSDINNCGACGRACVGDGVLSKQCASGLCVSACAVGHSNCAYPVAGADDGCETASDNTHCGSCANDCTKQGAGFTCGAGAPSQCGCTSDNDCRVTGSMGTCSALSNKCTCGGTLCQGGEACKKASGPDPDVCSCNGGNACSASQTCCQWPAGCRNLQTDPASCGACGHACPSGFFCSTGECACGGDFECNAGSAGTCAAGQCVCNGITCPKGQRCQPGGTCG